MMYKIKQGNIETVVYLSQKIDEFHDPHDQVEYEKRLSDLPHLILIAWAGDKAIGFKVGYERDGSFYSWMGGVKKAWRRKGVAKALADRQEAWVRQRGYDSITFKTRNRLKAMLTFAINNGFDIVGLDERPEVAENRILLRKKL